MTTPDSLETQHTLTTAVARCNELRARDLLASAAAGLENEQEPAGPAPLPAPEELELLALRSARVAGASWSQIGAALGTSKQSAWEAHGRWIDQQAELHGRIGYKGMDDQPAAAARG